MPSGLVEFTGTDTSTPPFAGTAAANLRDGDFTTIWAADGATGGYISIDLGAAAQVSRLRVASRIAVGDDVPGDKAIFSAVLRSASSDFPTFTNDAAIQTIGTIATVFYPARAYSSIEIASPGTARRYWRLVGTTNAYGPQLAECRFQGTYASGVSCKPVTPVITPWGGRFPNGFATVTMSCETTSAAIYYTTDGTTPDNTKTLYSAPFRLPIGSSGVTFKAVAYDATCTTTLSDVVTAYYKPYGIKPREDWYDDTGTLLEMHDGNILDNRARDGFFYGVGAFTNRSNSGVDILTNVGVWMYKSRDLLNWIKVGYILPNPGSVIYCMRPHLVYNPTTSKYVIVAHLNTSAGATGSKVGFAESSTVGSGWSWVKTDGDPNGVGNRDLSVWKEADDDLWLVYTDGSNASVRICRLNSSFTDFHATPQHTTIITGDREAPQMVKVSSTRRFLITSSSNYYDGTASFDPSWITHSNASPASGWPSIANLTAYNSAKTGLFASDPVSTDYNGQPASVLKLGEGRFMYLSDRWSATELYASRYVWVPLTFPTESTMRATTPTEFDFEDIMGIRRDEISEQHQQVTIE